MTAGTITSPLPKVSFVTQSHHHRWIPLTVTEVLRMGCYDGRSFPRRLSVKHKSALNTAIDQLAIRGIANLQISKLSGGERQRVFLAQALIRDAPVLLLDEPLTGVDLPTQDRIFEQLELQKDSGKTVVLSTHNLDEARHCDRILVLAGRLVAEGSPDDVLIPKVLRAAYGERLLGDHAQHDHGHEMILLDDHGHGRH